MSPPIRNHRESVTVATDMWQHEYAAADAQTVYTATDMQTVHATMAP